MKVHAYFVPVVSGREALCCKHVHLEYTNNARSRLLSHTARVNAPRRHVAVKGLIRSRNRVIRICRPSAIQGGGGSDGDSTQNGSKTPESLFMKELRRRGMKPQEGGMGEAGVGDGEGEGTRGNVAAPPRKKDMSESQLEKSRLLNSEGLEGLPTRAWELIRLGAGFPFSFWPLSLALIGGFVAVYLYFGQSFIHSGQKYSTPTGSPPYVEPYELLREEPPFKAGLQRVPYRSNPSTPNNE